MAAGLGFKDFVTGEVLTAADVDGYLMQGIWVFATAAARNAAVTAPAEGNFAFTKDTNSLWYYDGAAWVASGATGDIEGVTAGVGISGGGTSGTVTVTKSMATAITTAGDTLYGTGSGTFSRLGIGTAGQVLKVNSGATAPEWGAAGGASGLTLISSTTVGSAVSSVTISSAFSATYANYLIVASEVNGSAQTNAALTFGSTTTGYYYGATYVGFSSGTITGGNGSNVASIPNTLSYNSNDGCNLYMVVESPNLADNTVFYYSNVSPVTTGYYWSGGGFVNNTTAYTAFTLTPASGTITGGTIKVYGYQNS